MVTTRKIAKYKYKSYFSMKQRRLVDWKKLNELNFIEKKTPREEERAAATSICGSLPGLDSEYHTRNKDAEIWLEWNVDWKNPNLVKP